jgi:hypothetical protein
MRWPLLAIYIEGFVGRGVSGVGRQKGDPFVSGKPCNDNRRVAGSVFSQLVHACRDLLDHVNHN